MVKTEDTLVMSFFSGKDRVFKKFLSNFYFIIILFIGGCAHPISEDLRKSIDPTLSLQEIKQRPSQFSDQNVMFGGMIVATRNFPEKTEIEVIQKSLEVLIK